MCRRYFAIFKFGVYNKTIIFLLIILIHYTKVNSPVKWIQDQPEAQY